MPLFNGKGPVAKVHVSQRKLRVVYTTTFWMPFMILRENSLQNIKHVSVISRLEIYVGSKHISCPDPFIPPNMNHFDHAVTGHERDR